MKDSVAKFREIELLMSTEKGAFNLFALFLREDSPNKWDLVVSAPWIKAHDKETLDYFAKHLRSRLETEELISLSRVVLLDQDNLGLEPVHKALSIEHGTAEVKDSNFFGMQIKHAFIITSRRHPAPTAADL